jgi:hypothetical protein
MCGIYLPYTVAGTYNYRMVLGVRQLMQQCVQRNDYHVKEVFEVASAMISRVVLSGVNQQVLVGTKPMHVYLDEMAKKSTKLKKK